MATWKELITDPRYEKLDTTQRETLLTNWVADKKATDLTWMRMSDDDFVTALSHIRELGGLDKSTPQATPPPEPQKSVSTEDLTMGLLSPGGSSDDTPDLSLDYPRAFAKGAVGMVGSTIKGMGDLGKLALTPDYPTLFDSIMPESVNPRKLPWWATPQGLAHKGGEQVKKVAEAIGPPRERMTLGKEITEGVGQLGGQLAMYYLTGGVPQAMTLLAQGADQVEERLSKLNISEEYKNAGTMAGALVTHFTEKYGLEQLLNRVPPAIKNKILRAFTDITITGGIEAGQESVEGFLHNAIVKITGDPKTSLTEGTLHEAFVAGGSAGIVRAALTALGAGRVGKVRDFQNLRNLTGEGFKLEEEEVGLKEGSAAISESDIKDFVPELNYRSVGGSELPSYADNPIAGVPVSEDFAAALEAVKIAESAEVDESQPVVAAGESSIAPTRQLGLFDANKLAEPEMEQKGKRTYEDIQGEIDNFESSLEEKYGSDSSEIKSTALKSTIDKWAQYGITEGETRAILKDTIGLSEDSPDYLLTVGIKSFGQDSHRTAYRSLYNHAIRILKEQGEISPFNADRALHVVFRLGGTPTSPKIVGEPFADGKLNRDVVSLANKLFKDIAKSLNVWNSQYDSFLPDEFPSQNQGAKPAKVEATKNVVEKAQVKEEVAQVKKEADLSKYNLSEDTIKAINKYGRIRKGMDAWVRSKYPAYVDEFKIMRGEFESNGQSVLNATAEALEEIEKKESDPLTENKPSVDVAAKLPTQEDTKVPPLTSVEKAKVPDIFNKWLTNNSFDSLSEEEKDIMRRAGKAPQVLSDEEAYAEAHQQIGQTDRNTIKSTTIDFLGLQTSYERVVDAVMDTIKRLKLDFDLSRDDMRNLVINEWLQTPRDIAKRYPEFAPIVKAAFERELHRSKMEDMFFQKTKPFWDLHPARRKKVGELLFKGDFERKAYSAEELKKLNFTSEEFAAYTAIRGALDIVKNDIIHAMTEETKLNIRNTVKDMARNNASSIEIDATISKMIRNHEAKVQAFSTRMIGYMPHTRYGTYAIRILKKTENGLKLVRLESFERSLRKTASMRRYDALKFWESTKNEDEIVEAINLYEYSNEYYDNLPSSAQFEKVLKEVADMQKRLWEQGIPAPDIAAATDELLTKRRMVKGFSKHFVERKNIPGYSQDADRVLADYFNGYAGYKTKFIAATKMYTALAEIHPANQSRLYSYASEYVDYQLHNKSPEWHKAKAFLFHWFLSGNVKSVIVNGTQNFLTAAPLLTAYVGKGGYGRIVKAMSDKVIDKLTPDERTALTILRADGVTRDLMTSELMGRPDNYFQRNLVPGVLDALRFGFSSMEIFNRETTALAFYRAAREKGLSREEGIADTIQAVLNAHGAYTKSDRPKLGRGRKGIALTFRLFSIHYAQMLKNFAKSGQYKPMAQSVGVLLALAGVEGMIFFRAASWGFGELTQGDDLEMRIRGYIRAAAKAILGDDYPSIVHKLERGITRGIPAALLGIDFSGSIGMADIIPEMKLLSLLGVSGGLIERGLTGKRDLEAGDTWRGLEGFSPEFIRNPLTAIRLARDGMIGHQGKPVTDANGKVFKIGGYAEALKFFGFQPIELTERWKVADAQEKKRLYTQRLTRMFTDGIMVQMNKKNYDGVREIYDEMQEYNKDKAFDERIIISSQTLASRLSPPTGKSATTKRRAEEIFIGSGK